MPPRAYPSNPFTIPAACWVLHFEVHKDLISAIEEAFADMALASGSFELDEKKALWQVEITTDSMPSQADCIARSALLSELTGQTVLPPHIRLLEKKDWVLETARSFPPLRIGRFFVHGSHYDDALPPSAFALHIDAGLAFGSGEHATTSGCLLALNQLAKRRRFSRALEKGCGSGILAIALAKQWRITTLATHLDLVSVRVAADNVTLNKVKPWVVTAVQDGFRGRRTPASKISLPPWGRDRVGVAFGRHARDSSQPPPRPSPNGGGGLQKFDLIMANILARPLVSMARAMARSIAPGGVVILSGLLESQQNYVMHAYRKQGFRFVRRILQNGWATLVLEK